jgi:hypothetical protein
MGLVRVYYLDSGSLGIMALAKSMRMPLINLPACSLVVFSALHWRVEQQSLRIAIAIKMTTLSGW